MKSIRYKRSKHSGPRPRFGAFVFPALLAMLAALGGCQRGQEPAAEAKSGIVQTKFPGDFTSGGATSGQVMSQSASAAGSGNPSGTPGIPQGSGGNTGGAAMGGTTGGTAPPGGAQDAGKESAGNTPPAANTGAAAAGNAAPAADKPAPAGK